MTTELLIGIAVVYALIHISRIWLDRYWFYRPGFMFWAAVAAIVTPADPKSMLIVCGPLFGLHLVGMWAYHLLRRTQPVH